MTGEVSRPFHDGRERQRRLKVFRMVKATSAEKKPFFGSTTIIVGLEGKLAVASSSPL